MASAVYHPQADQNPERFAHIGSRYQAPPIHKYHSVNHSTLPQPPALYTTSVAASCGNLPPPSIDMLCISGMCAAGGANHQGNPISDSDIPPSPDLQTSCPNFGNLPNFAHIRSWI